MCVMCIIHQRQQQPRHADARQCHGQAVGFAGTLLSPIANMR